MIVWERFTGCSEYWEKEGEVEDEIRLLESLLEQFREEIIEDGHFLRSVVRFSQDCRQGFP